MECSMFKLHKSYFTLLLFLHSIVAQFFYVAGLRCKNLEYIDYMFMKQGTSTPKKATKVRIQMASEQ